jgi:hypothetical protein
LETCLPARAPVAASATRWMDFHSILVESTLFSRMLSERDSIVSRTRDRRRRGEKARARQLVESCWGCPILLSKPTWHSPLCSPTFLAPWSLGRGILSAGSGSWARNTSSVPEPIAEAYCTSIFGLARSDSCSMLQGFRGCLPKSNILHLHTGAMIEFVVPKSRLMDV